MDRRAKAVKHGPAFGHEFAAGIPDDGTTPRRHGVSAHASAVSAVSAVRTRGARRVLAAITLPSPVQDA
jgi:hypothetical protein